MGERTDAAVLLGVMNTLNGCHHGLRTRIQLYLDGLNEDGGPGSGNWGHSGRPGMRGGSMPGGGVKHRIIMEGGGYTSAAKQRKTGKSPEESEVEKYNRLREDAKKKWKEAEEAADRAKDARFRMNDAEDAGEPVPEDAEKEFTEWDAKYRKLHKEYKGIVEATGAATHSEKTLLTTDIKYNPVQKLDAPHTEEEIIKAVGGGDMTDGSCVSAALAYIGQKQGLDVLDFRGGESAKHFRSRGHHLAAVQECGGKIISADSAKTAIANGKRLLTQLEEGKQYYFVAGAHASIVRIQNGKPQYLELQSAVRNGWTDFKADVTKTLRSRFGCGSKKVATDARAVDIDQIRGEGLARILGYLNTNESEQRKGTGGGVR